MVRVVVDVVDGVVLVSSVVDAVEIALLVLVNVVAVLFVDIGYVVVPVILIVEGVIVAVLVIESPDVVTALLVVTDCIVLVKPNVRSIAEDSVVVSSVNVIVGLTILVNGFVVVVTKLVIVVANISNNDVSTVVLVPVIVAAVAVKKYVEGSDIASMTLNVYEVPILAGDVIIDEILPLTVSVSLELFIDDIEMLVAGIGNGVVEAMLDVKVIDGDIALIALDDVVSTLVIMISDVDNTVERISLFGGGSVVESVAIDSDGVDIELVGPIIDVAVDELVKIGIDGGSVIKLVVVLLVSNGIFV